MRTQRKHAEVIKAWADGEQIQQLSSNGWININSACDTICWGPQYSFRIKPELKDPALVLKEAWYKSLLGRDTDDGNMREWKAAAKALIQAYKAGELKDI